MVKKIGYDFSVGSSVDYEDLIVEITFGDRLGIIISQEGAEGDFDISLHSLFKEPYDSFVDSKNIDNIKIKLSELEEAIERAKTRLFELKRG